MAAKAEKMTAGATTERKRYFGLSMPILIGMCLVVLAAAYTGALSADLPGTFALMFVLGIIFNEVGNRIPIWNEYIGGGIVLAYLGTAALVYYNLIPQQYVESIGTVTGDMDFLTFFIAMLITGSILGLNRQLLVKSIVRYLPAILGGVAGAALLGILGGLIVGVSPADAVISYVLPVMGGGNGAGAIPLSQMYEKVTGNPSTDYYTFAIAILTIANIFAIIIGGILNRIGNSKKGLTGNKSNLMRNAAEIEEKEEKVKLTMKDYGGAMALGLSFYALGRLFGEYLLPTIGGVAIHSFAYMIIFVALTNALGLIPNDIRQASQGMQTFFTKTMVIVIMVGVGVDTDLGELFSAITFGNVLMALLVVIGATLGSAIVGWLVGFYPIDSAVTAGLCMANRGGSGDIAVLGAADRMGLISYAQLSSRLGGGIVLIIGSLIFGLFL
ncbi:2-hydroxycarboxylate transporter family protein [Carnobacterium mobile]|uniref:2-hydroxycarboxylate transporter family protein n=1 Tax=Carnobacterium mobile TaxID=2750 RepID=UPI000B215547|nr:2-hydroxycarboxylate transporter family protein [Carnobacterium mobile]